LQGLLHLLRMCSLSKWGKVDNAVRAKINPSACYFQPAGTVMLHLFTRTSPRKKSAILALLLTLATPIIHAHSRGTQPASTHVQQEVRTYLRNLGVSPERANKVRIYRFSGSQKECPFGLTDRDGTWINKKQFPLYPA